MKITRNDFYGDDIAYNDLSIARAYADAVRTSRKHHASRDLLKDLRFSMRFHARSAVKAARKYAERRASRTLCATAAPFA